MEKLELSVNKGELSSEEIQQYISYVREKNPGRSVKRLELSPDGEFINLRYELEPVKFQRIRRITGYLVGTLERFNDAKRHEEQDRVKHSMN